MRYVLLFILFSALSLRCPARVLPDSGHVSLTNNTFLIENDAICVTYDWNQGNLVLRNIHNKILDKTWRTEGLIPDFQFGKNKEVKNVTWDYEWMTTGHDPGNYLIKVIVEQTFVSHSIRRIILIRPRIPAISTRFYYRGQINSEHANIAGSSSLEMIESDEITNAADSSYLFALPFTAPHWQLEFVSFREATDYRNNLVSSRLILPYRTLERYRANLVLARNNYLEQGFYVLKESPIEQSQQGYPGYDFSASQSRLTLHGFGVSTSELSDWQEGYGYTFGLTDHNRGNQLSDLRSYQKSIRRNLPERDDMLLSNTWGDRSRDNRMNEAFILKELEAAHRLGITHVQLDDGWQTGLSKNSSQKQGKIWDDWQTTDWEPHPERFPNGLHRVAERARELSLEIGLWFNPSKKDSYANWERDAGILIKFYKTYGIRTFKIDGIELVDKKSEENLRKLFDNVVTATGGRAVFNMDVTAGHRMGYHYFAEYGNIFLENRYTDWGNYYPHLTLRNLWMLSEFMPPERLQIEFLNKWRNEDKYPDNDPLSPSVIPWEYQFAITMVAQPLAWMELSNLPSEAYEIIPVISEYKQHMSTIHSGQIFPIGEAPDGFGWTGFQSFTGDKEGYLLIFRENTDIPAGRVKTRLPASVKVTLTSVCGQGASYSSTIDERQMLKVSLPAPFSYALYKYRIEN